MQRYLTVSFILTFLTSIIWLGSNLSRIAVAKEGTTANYVELSWPINTLAAREDGTQAVQRNQSAITSSMAAPHVAGLAALIWSQNTTLTGEQVGAQIRNTAVDLGTSGWDSQFGYGRVDAAAAMAALQSSPPLRLSLHWSRCRRQPR